MSHFRRAGIAAGLLLATAAFPLAAQDSTSMKKGAMGDGMAMAPHGMFAGTHDHTVRGAYTIEEKDGQRNLVLGADFALDGAPDPYIVLSADEMGAGSRTMNLGALKHKKGTSTFAIPAGTDLAQYTQVLVWCKKYNVTLGHAELSAAGAMMRH